MALTKAQWAVLEHDLEQIHGYVTLMCDGYKVSAYFDRIKPTKLGVTVYVNGYIRWEWGSKDAIAPEAEKFWRQTKKFLYPAKERARYEKEAKSRKWDADMRAYFSRQATAHIVFWSPIWPTGKAFLRNIRKTCTSVEQILHARAWNSCRCRQRDRRRRDHVRTTSHHCRQRSGRT